MILSKT
ncbi:hypothetical protein CJF30_00003774 [Rutstroemia sp. NJR-2017a BBW]|nr:hypothetical protein CJF30_00003774 [Rutstroemia sp. NJR-2017a BBW]